MAMLAETMSVEDRRNAIAGAFRRKRLVAFAIPAGLLLYLAYVFIAFDVAGLAQRARLDNAVILVSDTITYKTHVTRDNRRGTVTVAIEGARKGQYPDGRLPDWVAIEGDRTVIDLTRGHVVIYDGPTVTYEIPGYGTVLATPGEDGVNLELPSPGVPDFINASANRVVVTTDAGRLTITRSRTDTFRYFYGWEMFFFTLDSPFSGKGPGELAAMAFSGERVDPNLSNVGAMARDFWNNAVWRHGEVAWAIFETLLMAFLGTFGAAFIALSLCFFAAQNFAPSRAVRFVVRRLFDFVRGVDALIFTIILSRAFGPGPMTGALAIMLTDSGSFGKLFSEALENVDKKQIEGVQSTGANRPQQYRFGVIPQVAPVLMSQVLYYLESNTRSATIIGAIVGGGIGLMLTQAIQTTQDWEQVSYYILLIVVMVVLMDTLSGWLRARMIGGERSPPV